MKQVLRRVASFISVVLLSAITLSVHAGAVYQASTTPMVGMEHRVASSGCITVCTSTNTEDKLVAKETSEEDNDTARQPFYLQLRSSSLTLLQNVHREQAKVAIEREAPPGLPPYILFSVLRL